jgi:DNA-directed RNA polymerase specialized sigma24 family protein
MAANDCDRREQIADLYAKHAMQLLRLVARRAGATPHVIEDACSFAWMQLLTHPHVDLRPPHWRPLAWLTQTAVREAWRLARREGRAAVLSEYMLEHVIVERDKLAPSNDEIAALRARLALLGELPQRPRRFLLRQMLGYTYDEIAELEGVTWTTTNKQLARAKRLLRELERRDHEACGAGGEKQPRRD